MTKLAQTPERFCLVFIKPSHYDDDGYVIQWFRAGMPSNSLAVLYGLAREWSCSSASSPINFRGRWISPDRYGSAALMSESAASTLPVPSRCFPRLIPMFAARRKWDFPFSRVNPKAAWFKFCLTLRPEL